MVFAAELFLLRCGRWGFRLLGFRHGSMVSAVGLQLAVCCKLELEAGEEQNYGKFRNLQFPSEKFSVFVELLSDLLRVSVFASSSETLSID